MTEINLVRFMDNVGLFDFYGNLRRKITKSQIIILIYHRVGPKTNDWSINPLDEKIFEYQLNYLIQNNFEIVSLDNLSEMIINDSIPEKTAVITFDDGYKDNYEFAFPILKKYNAPATIFLATGPIEQKKLFWWDEVNYALFYTDISSIDLDSVGNYKLNSDDDKINAGINIIEKLKKLNNSKKESLIEKIIDLSGVNIPQNLNKHNILSWNEIKRMNKKDIEFGAHTVNHPILTNISIEEAKWEILNSKNCIEENLETEIKSFAYPNGDYNDKIASLVENLGFNFICFSISYAPSKKFS